MIDTQLVKSFYNETYIERYGSVSESTVKFTWALTTALFIPGGMFGSFLGGWLADVIGRSLTRHDITTLSVSSVYSQHFHTLPLQSSRKDNIKPTTSYLKLNIAHFSCETVSKFMLNYLSFNTSI